MTASAGQFAGNAHLEQAALLLSRRQAPILRVSCARLRQHFSACPPSLLRDNCELARGITLGHPRASVLFYAILGERVAEPIFRQSLHALNRLYQVFRWQSHEQFIVQNAAVAALRKARNGERRLTPLECSTPTIGARALTDDAPVESLVAAPLEAIDEVHHGPWRGI